MTLPRVRLSKDGEWAICASIPCGERFARRVERRVLELELGLPQETVGEQRRRRWKEWTSRRRQQQNALRFGEGRFVLYFLPGWHWFTGAWQMSKRARQRVNAGRSPADRRTTHPTSREAREDGWPRDRRRPTSRPNSLTYPVTVICPACGLRQEADADALRLT